MARRKETLVLLVLGYLVVLCRADDAGESNEPPASSAPVVGAPAFQGMQVLHEEARVFLIPNFLSDAECDHLISQAEPLLQRSGVVQTQKDGSGESITHSIRTSSGAFLERGGDAVIRRIESRIADWTQLPVENGEDVQVLRYQPEEKYDAHWDYFFDNSSISNGGNRVATVLVYLSDADQGGETIFPLIPAADGSDNVSECAKNSLAVKPVKGTALLFHSMTAGGVLEPRSLHASCPVVSGSDKWVMTKWIHTGEFHTRSGLEALIKARVAAHMQAQAKRMAGLQNQLALALGVAAQRRH